MEDVESVTIGKPGIKHKSIYAALPALQGELKVLEKTAEVDFATNAGKQVKYKYTPLAKEVEALYPLMAKHGLSFRHEKIKDGDKDAIIAILTHETAQWIEMEEESVVYNADGTREVKKKKTRILEGEIKSGPVQISAGGSDMKDTGSAITYARRYTLEMVLGLASEEDTDARNLEVKNADNAQVFAFTKVKKGIADETDMVKMANMLSALKQDRDRVTKKKQPSSLGLKPEQFDEAIKLAEEKMGKLEQEAEAGQ